MNISENAPVWEVTEPSKEFKVERNNDISVIDRKIAKLEELIEGLLKNPSPQVVGAGISILNVDTSNVRKKYEAMLSAEESRRRETLQGESKLNNDYKGFEERVAFIDKAKAAIHEDAYIMEEVLSHNSGQIAIDYYNCEPERESLEQIIAYVSDFVETPPEITAGVKYLTYHIKAESGKDLFLIYSEESGFKIFKDDFNEEKMEEVPTKAAALPPMEETPASLEADKPAPVNLDYAVDKPVYQLIFDAVQISFPDIKVLDNINFYDTYSKLQETENIEEKLSRLFTKLSISSAVDNRIMMASPIEHKIVTVFNQLVKKTSIKEELQSIENWLNDDKTLDKKSMSGTALATHNAVGYDARKAIEDKEEPYRLYCMILGYRHFFNIRFPYVVDCLRDHGDILPQQRKMDTPYYIKPCPAVPLYKELSSLRNDTLQSMLLSLQQTKLRGVKNAEKERIVRDIQTLDEEMELEAKHIERFNIDKLLGKEHFEHAIIDLEKRTKALSH